MKKRLDDIIYAVGLTQKNKSALIVRIRNKYKIINERITHAYEFTEEQFDVIVSLEKKRMKDLERGITNYEVRERSVYSINRERGMYHRITL